MSIAYDGECTIDGCTSNADCPSHDYCEKMSCDGMGQCVEKPMGCYLILAPVCGCDGLTYDNDCLAASTGMNVDYAGPCEGPSSCTANNQCAAGEYCQKETCNGTGTCKLMPEGCGGVFDPVCGCDGKTYSNACIAASAGVNVDYGGECGQLGNCTSNAQCAAAQYRAKEGCEGPGFCQQKPMMCPDVYAPVCGCDGKSYGNSCYAAAAGMNVDPNADCGGGSEW